VCGGVQLSFAPATAKRGESAHAHSLFKIKFSGCVYGGVFLLTVETANKNELEKLK